MNQTNPTAASPTDFAILVRTNAQAAALECALLARRIPVRVAGAKGGVWSTTPGRDVLAYLRAAEGRADDDLARVANKPLRYIRREKIEWAVRQVTMGASSSIIDALYTGHDRALTRLAHDLSDLASKPWADRCAAIADMLILDLQERAAESGAKSADADDDREATYKALAEAAAAMGSVEAIEKAIAEMKKNEDEPAVTISSIHRSKGAEWEVVYVAGVSEGVLPHKKAEEVEEERRLFYVAATRAKKTLVLSTGGAASSFLTAPASPTPEDDGEKGGSGEDVDGSNETPSPAAAPLPLHTDSTTPSDAPHSDATQATASTDSEVLVTYASLRVSARSFAEGETAQEPPATKGEGGRYVTVQLESFRSLLGVFGAAEATEHGQVVFSFRGPNRTLFKIYSTVPAHGEVARELGEDSIRVAVLDEVSGSPVLGRKPWVARTRGWRLSLLDRIEEVLTELATRPECSKCGHLMRERKGKHGAFLGCVNFPDCQNTMPLPASTEVQP